MSEKELQNKDKTVSKMTRDGLFEENLTKETSIRVSERKENLDFDSQESDQKQEYRRERFQRNQNQEKGEETREQTKDTKGKEEKGKARNRTESNSEEKNHEREGTKENSQQQEIIYSNKTKKAVKKVTKADEKCNKRYKKIPKKKRLKFKTAEDEEENFLGSAQIEKHRLHFENKTNKRGEVIYKTSYKRRRAAARRHNRMVEQKIEGKFFAEEEDNAGIKGTHYGYKTFKLARNEVGKSIRVHRDPIHRYQHSLEKAGQKNAKANYFKFLDENAKENSKKWFKKSLQKRRYKKKFAEAYKKTGNATYAANQARSSTVKASRKIVEVLAKIKNIILSVGSGAIFFIIIIILLFAVLMLVLNIFGVGMGAVYPGDDLALTDANAYYTELEADLDNTIKHIEEENQGYDEYQYHLDTIGHDQTVLLSYLAIVFEDFVIEEVKPTLNYIFEEQYELELKEEIQVREREVEIVDDITGETETKIETFEYKILHITLHCKDLKELLLSKIPEEDKERFEIYIDTEGARQIFGNPFDFDWKKDISSPFGWRIHPISGDKKFHTGIDIAEPAGTPIKAVMSGTVVISRYSDSAGNFIAIQDKDGYITKYMHCTKLFVKEGAQVKRGDLIATVGTTGNSTGNHLHLDVIDPNGNYLDPVIVVSSFKKEE